MPGSSHSRNATLAALRGRRILLTGASGFLGGALLDRCAAAGVEVVTLGRSPPRGPGATSHVEADLARPGALRAALDGLRPGPRFDALVHLAVSRRHRDFPDGALDMFHVNASAAAELLDFARATGIGRAAFGSTGTVYGDVAEGEASREGEFRAPASYFAASKLFADAMCGFYRTWFRLATLRFYAPYGPGLGGRMLTDLAARVREGRPLSLPPAGPGLSFAATYVDDAIAVLVRALAEGWSEDVNVAAPEAWTIEGTGRLLGDLLGREPCFERRADVAAPRMLPDTARLQALMPDHAFTGLRDGLRAMLAAPTGGAHG